MTLPVSSRPHRSLRKSIHPGCLHDLLHDRTGRLESDINALQADKNLHDRTGRLEKLSSRKDLL
ncbi:hypothetical protein AO370_0377 [Moraxella catarrhalis]|uniref:Uncharacterized protein n=1 Tax=Moraxella catarrhalis TaxID=480 RepID=A0AB36DQN8_MORCA|nr:hypothetical protein AO370_0377 [Moraxella catarrhalis]